MLIRRPDDRAEDKAKSAQAIELINRFDLHSDFNHIPVHARDSGKLKGVQVNDGGTEESLIQPVVRPFPKS